MNKDRCNKRLIPFLAEAVLGAGRGEGTAPTIGHAHKFFRLRLLRNELDMPALINTTVSSITVLVCCSKQPRVLAARRLFPDVQIYSIAHRSMANSRKVLCPLFDEFEILMRGDSPSICGQNVKF